MEKKNILLVQNLTIGASLLQASFYYWCRPCSVYHIVLHEKVIFALCDSSHFEADILLVLGPQCMTWPETSTTSLFAFVGFVGRFLLDLMWVCLLA